MSRLHSKPDECAILIKAQPHRSSQYFETVCCAGIGRDGKWRRQYPIPYRILEEPQKFKRWNWISYRYTDPGHDGRAESQKVVANTIEIAGTMRESDRVRFINPFLRDTLEEAASLAESLTLLRPKSIELKWRKKSVAEVETERSNHANLVAQHSLFDKQVTALDPCPYEFRMQWKDQDGKGHNHVCDDWETPTAFYRRRKAHGETEALRSLKETYEHDYFSKGLCLGFSTHSRRTNQWLLVGVIRLDPSGQGDFLASL